MKQIVFILSDCLQTFCSREIEISFSRAGRFFNRIEGNDFHGFYDWLRNDSEEIIGLRYFLFEDYQYLLEKLEVGSFIDFEETSLGNRVMYIYLSSNREFNEAKSKDQLFMDDYLYRSDDGIIAMSFGFPEKGKLLNDST